MLILLIDSNESPPLIKIPFSAPFPVPTITAVGIAKPKAHGQDITTIEVKTNKDNSSPIPAMKYQNKNAPIAINTTIGTK
ncbi:hypothetical protein ES703_82395 [subsurface metagenome]